MTLEELYSALPEIKCPKGCIDCCSQVYMTKGEAKKLKLQETSIPIKNDLKCSLCNLTQSYAKGSAGCTVYDKRPFICRLFGTSSSGEFSCSKVLSGDFITNQRAWELLAYYAILITKDDVMPSEEIVKNMEDHDDREHAKGNLRRRRK